jgi:hypothetical protein
MIDFLKKNLKIRAELAPTLDYYKDFETKIDSLLDEDEKNWNDSDEKIYSIGANYAEFLGTSFGEHEIKWADNHQAAMILKKEFSKLYPDNKLVFDTEASHCYVYTKDRQEAKTFLTWVYNTYIKDYLKDWYEGWDEFVEEFNKAKDTDQLINQVI